MIHSTTKTDSERAENGEALNFLHLHPSSVLQESWGSTFLLCLYFTDKHLLAKEATKSGCLLEH
jgi:hypothetical protein